MNHDTTTPAGATTLYPWEDRDGEPVRHFRGACQLVETVDGTIEVAVEGTQTVHGVRRCIVIDGKEATADQARRLTEALGAMLAEVER